MEGSRRIKTGPEAGSRICDWYDVGRKLHVSRTTGCELFAALHKPTGGLALMKAVDRQRLGRNYAQPVHLYSKLSHPHICQLLEVFDSAHFVMVCEIIDGLTLTDFMKHNGLAVSETQQVFHQLAAAVAHMHSEGVCHRNLCLDNVMLAAGATCNVKVIDFACAGPTLRALTRKMATATALYSAPELLGTTVEYYGAQTDVWALGVILHVLLTGKFPFTSEKAIREGSLSLPASLDDDAKALLRGCLAVDPAARLTADAVCQQPWVAAAADMLGGSVTTKSWSEPTVDAAVVEKLAELGMDAREVKAAVAEKRRDELTTAYFLMERMPPPGAADDPASDPAADPRTMSAPAAPATKSLDGASPRSIPPTVQEDAACPSA